MNEEDYQKWSKNVDVIVCSQIILNKLKKHKKITSKKYKEINKKIKKMTYKNFLNSPCFENREELRKEAFLLCVKDEFSNMFLAI